MNDFSVQTEGNPAPGVIFERYGDGSTVVLNPDITVTISKDGISSTIIPSLDQWLTWQLDAFDALTGNLPNVQLGAVGIRIAENYEANIAECLALRSAYAA